MRQRFLGCLWMLPLAFVFSLAETVKDREGAVRDDRAKMESSERWIYNDYEKGFQEAKRTGKPLLVTLRCVPCLACAGIDAQILIEDPSLTKLLDQFVCVRVINANSLDLSLFQFDPDLSFSTLFFAGDGTVLGRFGSWQHQNDAQERSTEEFKGALQSALKLFSELEHHRSALQGKQPKPFPYKRAVNMPALAGRYNVELDWQGKVVQSCVHCHQIGDAVRTQKRTQPEGITEQWIYPYPDPQTVGLLIRVTDSVTIAAVSPDSLAAKAGFEQGDTLLAINDQPLISTADISWILHQAKDGDAMTATVSKRPDNAPQTLRWTMPSKWRHHADIARRVGTWDMRRMALGGMKLRDLSDQERQRHGIAKNKLALLAEHVGQYGKHAVAKKAGLVKGDIITEIDGRSERLTESQLIGQLILAHPPGESISLELKRGDSRRRLNYQVQ